MIYSPPFVYRVVDKRPAGLTFSFQSQASVDKELRLYTKHLSELTELPKGSLVIILSSLNGITQVAGRPTGIPRRIIPECQLQQYK